MVAEASSYCLAFDTANEVIAIGVGRLEREGSGAVAAGGEGKASFPCTPGRDAGYAGEGDVPSVHCIGSVRVEAHRASNTRLLTCIDSLLKETGVGRSDLACVAVGAGPGSFTGVRIAMATAKGIASALGLGLIALSSLDAVAWNCQRAGVRGPLTVLADAMRKEVYPVRYRLTDGGADRLDADSVVKAEVQAETMAGDGGAHSRALAGDALVKYGELFAPCGAFIAEDLWTPTGEGLLAALQALWREGGCDPFDAARHNPAFALPVYTRLSDAEEAERRRIAQQDQSLAGKRGSKHITMNDMALPNARAGAEGVAFKPLDAAHVGAVAAMEGKIMGSDAWNEALVADELGRGDRLWWAAYEADPAMPLSADAPLVGYVGGWVVDGDVQVLKIGTDPAHRRRGLAAELLSRMVSDARSLGARTSSLEVRVSNEGARAFYEKAGYRPVGIRPRYYSDGEDALIMKAEMLPAASRDVAGMDIQRFGTAVSAGASDGQGRMLRSEASQPSLRTRPCSSDDDDEGAASEGRSQVRNEGCGASERSACPRPSDALRAAPAPESPVILAIESSCDETAAAIIDGDGALLADVLASQVDFHGRFGGVVPEIASRKHIEAICGVCDACFDEATRSSGRVVSWDNLDAVAVTYAPGLVGALVVGVAFAKGAAWALDVPFIGVNHLEGHLYANKVGDETFAPPAVVSLVSGGNTMLVYMADWGSYEVLGTTIDDAVGEAFDKVAKALGLGYPGGPIIARLAAEGNPTAIDFPRAMLHSGDLSFSLSGLKTAVVTYINKEREAGRPLQVADIAASFQQAVVDVQVAKVQTALQQTGAPTFCLGGGVAANPVLRAAYEELCESMGVKLVMPPLHSCGDNAGMIALVALDRYRAGRFFGLDADALAHADLEQPY